MSAVAENEIVLVRDAAADRISYTESALEAKALALEMSGLIGRVSSDEDEKQAYEAQKALANLTRFCEKSRKEVKEPVLALGKAIDNAAKTFVEDLDSELRRISKLIGDWNALKLAKQQAAEAAARAEQERIARERFEEEKRIAREAAEAQRKLDEEAAALARQAAEATNAEEAAKAEQLRIDLEKRKQQAEADSLEKFDALAEEASRKVAAVVVPVAQKLEGQVIRQEWEITVTDKWALARAHPGCVDIVPRISEIKAALNAGSTLTGVTATKVTKATTRSK